MKLLPGPLRRKNGGETNGGDRNGAKSNEHRACERGGKGSPFHKRLPLIVDDRPLRRAERPR